MKEEKIYSRTRFCFANTNNNYFTRQGNKVNKKFINIICIMVVATITCYSVIKAINPILNQLCVDRAKNIATKISNEEASVIMRQYNYEDLVTIERDTDQNIRMLQINTKNLNEIISDIPVRIIDRFKQEENCNITIYSGSILGTKIFASRGPKIHIKITNIGNVDTKLESEFKAQGINQTLHRIYLQVKCEATILTPYDTIKQKIENQVLLAESVIVGSVPNLYYDLNGIKSLHFQ